MKTSNRVGIRTCSDYSPFGVELDGRTVSGGYRYGFQKQEKDNEIKGEGNSVNYLFRMHDQRLGRFFSVDPLMNNYPFNSSFAFGQNNLIASIELEGKQALMIIGYRRNSKNEIFIQITGDDKVEHNASAEYSLRVPAGTIGNSEDFYFTKDDFGAIDFGFKELQKLFDNGEIVFTGDQRNVVYKNESVLQAMSLNNPKFGCDFYNDILYINIGVTKLHLNEYNFTENTQIIDVEGDFSNTNNIRSFKIEVPNANIKKLNYELNFNDNGIENTFEITGLDDEILKDENGAKMSASGIGVFNFSVPSNSIFKIDIYGNTNSGEMDTFKINGTLTTRLKSIKHD
jgi:RHS repeat-associated protein